VYQYVRKVAGVTTPALPDRVINNRVHALAKASVETWFGAPVNTAHEFGLVVGRHAGTGVGGATRYAIAGQPSKMALRCSHAIAASKSSASLWLAILSFSAMQGGWIGKLWLRAAAILRCGKLLFGRRGALTM
jgi:hypothetical protein